MSEDTVMVWQAPEIEKPEFRLYYDDKGKVVCYTGAKIPGQYIVIDAATFAQGRPDVRVIDGKISTVAPGMVVSKLVPGITGITCSPDDISIIVDDGQQSIKWSLVTYEL